MSSSNCCFLTCTQVSQEAGQVVWYSHLFQNFPQFVVIHRVKGFGVVSKAEIDVFLKLSCFFDDPAGIGNLISGSSAFSKTSLNIWKLAVHVLLKPGLESFEHYLTSVWDEVQSCGSLSFLWGWLVVYIWFQLLTRKNTCYFYYFWNVFNLYPLKYVIMQNCPESFGSSSGDEGMWSDRVKYHLY